MAATPTLTSQNVWQSPSGEDFLQLKSSSGAIQGWIDSTGTPLGNLSSGGGQTGSRTLYVDTNRTDIFTPDGSIGKPFKTIQAAINQVAANGDNTITNPYEIRIAAGNYSNDGINLSNPALVNLVFLGYGVSGGANFGISAVNNDNLIAVVFVGLSIGGSIVFSSTTNNTNFLSGTNGLQGNGAVFFDCLLNGSNFTATNAGTFLFVSTASNSAFVFNNCGNSNYPGANLNNCIINGGASFVLTTNLSNPIPNGFSATQIQFHASTVAPGSGNSIDASSSVFFIHSRIRSDWTVNGVLSAKGSSVSGAITVNNGGRYTEDTGSGRNNTLTINAGGQYTQTGTYGIGGLILGQAAPTVPANEVGMGSTTATTATAGAQTLPANPAGFLIINVGGTTQKIPYYNN